MGRGKTAAEPIVRDFTGVLQSDGYVVYDSVCASREITPLGCWAHARRRFYQACENGDEGAAHYLLLIRELYAIKAKKLGRATKLPRRAVKKAGQCSIRLSSPIPRSPIWEIRESLRMSVWHYRDIESMSGIQ